MNVANALYIVYRVMFRDYVAKQQKSGMCFLHAHCLTFWKYWYGFVQTLEDKKFLISRSIIIVYVIR